MYYDWDWKAAEASSDARCGSRRRTRCCRACRHLLLNLGRFEESSALVRRALALDPLNVARPTSLSGWLHSIAGRLAEAESAGRKALELGPDRAEGPFPPVRCPPVAATGRRALAAARARGRSTFRLLGIALAELALGHAAESDAALRELIREHGRRAAYQIARLYAMRGDPDHAFEWLERAYRQRDAGLASMQVDHLLGRLHDDPRWRRLLGKMGFAE